MIDFYPGTYATTLQLDFLNSLTTPSGDNPLSVVGDPSPSFECGAWTCPGDNTRYLVSGFAYAEKGSALSSPLAVPEPATWAMLILGAGLVGAGLRFNRRRAPLAA